MTAPVLTLTGVAKLYRRGSFAVRAVDGVSLAVAEGETLGIVGESGCGKSTLARMALMLTRPTAGAVAWRGEIVSELPEAALRPKRALIQAVFQDPYAAMNPRMKVGDIIAEPLVHLRIGDARGRAARVAELLEQVGLAPDAASRLPRSFSGGQRQRIAIARALAPNPSLIVCDEAVSALDVSVRAQIINLLRRLQVAEARGYLFISHDLAVVRHVSRRVAVMYLGRVVELAPAEEMFASPAHPYTQSLISAVPRPDPDHRRTARRLSTAEPQSGVSWEAGCAFRNQCPNAGHRCATETPSLVPGPTRAVACHFPSVS